MTEITALAASPVDMPPGAGADADYWLSLINEKVAADFLNVTPRTMQSLRQRGGGPPYRRLMARCLRYTRADLKTWADKHLRTSTSDTEPEGATA